MAQSSQAKALVRVLVYEGGKVDHPADPGGRTNKGVTQRVYNAYRARKGLKVQDVYKITDGEVSEIYDAQYWDKIKGDDLPPGVDFVVFDGAVNSGPVQSVKWLQRALSVKVDGVVGDVTLRACREHPDHDRLVSDICARRMAFLRALRTFPTFGSGWSKRVASVRANGQAMAAGTIGPQPAYTTAGAARALIEDAKEVRGKSLAGSVTGGGVVATGLTQVTEAVQPIAEQLPALSTVIATVTALGVIAGLAGGVYLWWASRQQRELADALDLPRAMLDPANDDVPAGVVEAAA